MSDKVPTAHQVKWVMVHETADTEQTTSVKKQNQTKPKIRKENNQ